MTLLLSTTKHCEMLHRVLLGKALWVQHEGCIFQLHEIREQPLVSQEPRQLLGPDSLCMQGAEATQEDEAMARRLQEEEVRTGPLLHSLYQCCLSAAEPYPGQQQPY